MRSSCYRNRIIVKICLLLLAGEVGCIKQSPNESKVMIDLTNLGQRNQRIVFSEIRDVSQLPIDIVTQLTGGISNPTEPFRKTDVGDARLPARRLVVAGISDHYVLLDYEKGGISDYFVLALFLRSKQQAALVSVSGSPRGTQLIEIKGQIESGKLKNELGKLIY
jgi:hypothetical protein